jgi:HPt (histidine-containing phosphotransfer) domain-containing protein
MNTNDDQTLIDLSYVEELAGGKPEYMKQVITIFMDNTYPGVDELERLIKSKAEFEPISKQAHFLKSSVGIIKIKDMYDTFKTIELLAKEKQGREEIERLLETVLETFTKAKPLLLAKMKKKK